jgi:hypothetical protein
MESVAAEHIKAVILANRGPEDWMWEKGRVPDTNTRCLTAQHVTSAVALPKGHPVRAILAIATIERCLRHQDYHFVDDTTKTPKFARDLLQAIRVTTANLAIRDHEITFKDPISGERLRLHRPEYK